MAAALAFVMVMATATGSAITVGFGSRFLARSLDLIDMFACDLLACSSAMALAIGASVYLALARRSNH
ncbi:MAG: hypothetical protein V3V97_06235 [Hyphomicrobiaceae bacterium]